MPALISLQAQSVPMGCQPPTPATPTAPTIGPATDTGLLVTTAQLATQSESLLGQRLSETALEELLFSLEAAEYVEWIGFVPGEGTVWDFTETPERLADAIVRAVIARLP